MLVNSTRAYKIIFAILNLIGTLLSVKNTHTLYSRQEQLFQRGEMTYPKPRIINHSQIEKEIKSSETSLSRIETERAELRAFEYFMDNVEA